MRELIIKNVSDIKPITRGKDGNKFFIKPVVADKDIDNCDIAFIEIPIGCYAFGYHYHDTKEEIFFIISGTGKLRTYQGEKNVGAGDMLCFPTGEKGSHILSNTSESESLVFIDFGAYAGKIDIVTLPDINKIILKGNHYETMIENPTLKEISL